MICQVKVLLNYGERVVRVRSNEAVRSFCRDRALRHHSSARPPAQLERQREGVARYERVQRHRGWRLPVGSHQVRYEYVGNALFTKSAPPAPSRNLLLLNCRMCTKVSAVQDLAVPRGFGTVRSAPDGQVRLKYVVSARSCLAVTV